MTLHLRTLGALRIETASGEVVSFPEGKPLALLVYLAAERRPVRRGELAQIFWPRSPRDRAFQSLRQALWVIRRTLGDEVISGSDPLEVPRTVLRTDLEEPELSEPVGPFLESFALAGSPAWEEWVEETSGRVRRLRGTALHGAAVQAHAKGEVQAALAWAREATEVDPRAPEHHMLLAGLLLDRMEPEAAGRALARARLEVDDPQGAAALAELEARVVEQARTRPESGALRRPELVGRTAELALLQAEWRRAARGESRTLVLRGNLGTGRSRLAEETAAWVTAQGGLAITVRSTQSEHSLPFGYVALLASRLLTRPGGRGISAASDSVLRALVPSLNKTPPAMAWGGTPAAAAVADAVVDLVGAVAHEHPLFLVLDDLRWADASSRSLLLRVARELRTEAVLLVLVLPRRHRRTRHDEVLPGLEELEREERVRSVILEKLELDHIQELLSAHLDLSGHLDPGDAVQRLHEASGGNPLFLVEILELLRSRGAVARVEGGWRLEAPLPDLFPLPDSIGAVLELRVSALDGPRAALAELLVRSPPSPRLDSEEAARLEPALSDPAVFGSTAGDLVSLGLARWNEGGLEPAHEGARAALDRRFRKGVPGVPLPLRDRSRTWATGALAVAAVLAAWVLLRPASPPPYGGGQLVIPLAGGEVLRLSPRPGSGQGWRPERIDPPPRSLSAQGPFLVDGTERWFLLREQENGTPRVARWSPGGGEEEVFARPGVEVSFAGMSPEGSMLAFLADDPGTPGHDLGLVVTQQDGSDPRTIYQAPGAISSGGWSADGSRILVVRPGHPDTVLTITPTGERLEEVALPGVEVLSWCGPHDQVAVVSHDPSGGVVLHHWTPATGQLQRIAAPGLLAGPVTCSPDGRWVVHAAADRARVRLVLRNLESGQVLPLPLDDVAGARPRWVAPAHPVLRGVTIEGDAPTLALGERRPLSARTFGSDGLTRNDPISWRALDPGIVSVTSEGVLTGNRPGVGAVVARAGVWRADTIRVRVEGDAAGPDLLLQDSFYEVDPRRWEPVGWRHAGVVILEDGGPALRISGDGGGRGGIRTVDSFPLEQGLTVEVSVLLPPTPPARQSFQVALMGPRRPRTPAHAGEGEPEVSITYPAGEMERFDPGAIGVGVHGYPFRLALPGEAPPGEWMRLTLVVRPDGQVSVRVNGDRAGMATLHADLIPDRHWRIELTGASLETGLLVRDLVIWRGAR